MICRRGFPPARLSCSGLPEAGSGGLSPPRRSFATAGRIRSIAGRCASSARWRKGLALRRYFRSSGRLSCRSSAGRNGVNPFIRQRWGCSFIQITASGTPGAAPWRSGKSLIFRSRITGRAPAIHALKSHASPLARSAHLTEPARSMRRLAAHTSANWKAHPACRGVCLDAPVRSALSIGTCLNKLRFT